MLGKHGTCKTTIAKAVSAMPCCGSCSQNSPSSPRTSVAAISSRRSTMIHAAMRGVRWRRSNNGASSPTRPGDQPPAAFDRKNRRYGSRPAPRIRRHFSARVHRPHASTAISAANTRTSSPASASPIRRHPMYQMNPTYNARPTTHR